MRRTWIGPIIAAAAVVLIAAPRVLAAPLETGRQATDTRSSAQTTASCLGDGCQGKMAAAQGCEDDRVQVGGFVRPASADGLDAELNVTLWHSPACNSAWAELDLSTHNDNDFLRFAWIDEYGRSATRFEDEIIADPGNYPTPMVSWHNSIQVCIGADKVCSGWR